MALCRDGRRCLQSMGILLCELHIRPRPDEEGAWDGYVTEHPAATMFHRAGWRRVIAQTYGHRTHYLLARRGGSLCGVLPLVEVRSPLFGHSMVSVGFFVYGGIVASDGEAEIALAGAALELGRSSGVGYVELRSLTPLLSDWITKDDLYATFRQPLEVAEAAALARIPRKKRADVRKSLNSGLVVDVTTDTNRFTTSTPRASTIWALRYFRVASSTRSGPSSGRSASCRWCARTTSRWRRCSASTFATRSCPTSAGRCRPPGRSTPTTCSTGA